MRKIIFLGLLLFLVFSLGCTETCDSGVYNSQGECCNALCTVACDAGYQYKEGTCNCQCEPVPSDETDINLDDLFDDGNGVEPPVLPS